MGKHQLVLTPEEISILLTERKVLLWGAIGEPAVMAGDDQSLIDQATQIFESMLPPKARGMRRVQAIFNLFDRLCAKYRANGEVVCGSECSVCCHQLVGCTQFEYELIRNFLKRLPLQKSKDILNLARERAAAYSFMIGIGAESMESQDNRDLVLFARQFHMGKPCVFLGESGQCSVYPARPLDCRICMVKEKQCRPYDMVGPKPVFLILGQVICDLIYAESERVLHTKAAHIFIEWILDPELGIQ